jgi:hypothetical protein
MSVMKPSRPGCDADGGVPWRASWRACQPRSLAAEDHTRHIEALPEAVDAEHRHHR